MNQHKVLALTTLMVMKVIYVMQRFAKANEKITILSVAVITAFNSLQTCGNLR